MIPQNLRFICAQPHDPYFAWQVEVLLTNFREKGIIDRSEVIVYYPPEEKRNPEWDKLIKKYQEAKFFFYTGECEGVKSKLYIPQLRPFILKQHFRNIQGGIWFYHDCDILFNYLPDFNLLCDGPVCWQSDTSSYTDYTYLVDKERQGNIPHLEVVTRLAEIGEITPEVIKKYDRRTGGAQYILKNIDSLFWEDVEQMCLRIRKYLMEDVNKKYFASENAGFQSWCADMWAVNFSLWKRGIETDITNHMDFSWATDHIDVYYKKPIFHNAGVNGYSKGMFYKVAWQNRSPLGLKFAVSKNFASSMYAEAIRKVKP